MAFCTSMTMQRRRTHSAASCCSTPAISRPSSPLGRLGAALADDAAVEHHQDAVRQRADLVELDRDQQDRLAARRAWRSAAVDELDRADIDAARRLADEEHAGILLHLAREHDLLLVAAGESSRSSAGSRAGGCRISRSLAGIAADGVDVEERAASGIAARRDSRGWSSRSPRRRAPGRRGGGPPAHGRGRGRAARRGRRAGRRRSACRRA